MTWSPADLAALADLATALAADEPATVTPPLELVRKHGLGPLAYTHGLAAFRNDHVVSSMRADQQRAIAIEAVAALAPRGIPVALLKGISYAGSLYADPGERPMSDVDLLVPRADHPAAVKLLGELGYRHAGPGVQRSPRHHAVTLKRATGGSVDLHRSPTQLGRVAIDEPGVWARSRTSAWIPGALSLDPIDELLFHAVNLARSDLIAPLRAFVDAARLLGRVDPATLQARAREWRFARVLGLCLAVVNHVIADGPPPGWWLPRKIEILRGARPHRAVQIGRKLLLVEGPRELWALGRAVADGVIHARREPPR